MDVMCVSIMKNLLCGTLKILSHYFIDNHMNSARFHCVSIVRLDRKVSTVL
jgi:hypothetical protein